MLSEQAVSRSWQKLFADRIITAEKIERAESLLEQIRPESPLRHRLADELEELRLRCEEPSEA